MLISERIYKYMEEKKISQIEFSRRTGITQSTVSDWRRKGTNPSADKIMIICEVLGITPYELLLDTDNKKMNDEISNKNQEIERLKNLNSKLQQVNGNLLLQIPTKKEEVPKNKEEKKPFNMRDVFDEKGNFKI